MRQSQEKVDELDLDLPALDGETDLTDDALDMLDDESGGFAHDIGDAFDDSTGEGGPHEELGVDGAETGWLVDAETAGGLDIGPFDVAIEAEGKVLEEDDAETRGT